jgi:hypothetical protein
MSNLLEKTGKIVFLRAHDLGTGYGPPNDQLDVEAVFILNAISDGAYGFQLRNDANLPARQAMFSLLRDAFVNNLPVTTDFLIDTGKKNGTAIRVALTRSQIVSPVPVPHVTSGQVIRGQALPAINAGGKSVAKATKARSKPKSRKAR